MSINSDYRNSEQCPSLTDVAKKKSGLDQKIRAAHTRTKIIYNRINEKSGDYFKEFANIYNLKCAYCGAALKFTDGRLFEIDHYVCESAFANDTAGRVEAGKIDNLAFSCYSCNRGKGGLHIKNGYLSMLNPDDNSIANVFFRDEMYYIKPNNDYCEDKFIQSFYEELMLGSEFRRLDFLLLEMDALIKKVQTSNEELASKLEQCMNRLLQKKNCVFI